MISPPSVGPGAHPKRHHHGSQSEGESTLGRGKGIGDDRHARREEERATQSLEDAGGDEQGREEAAPQSTEPSVKSASPATQTGLRPRVSDKRPNVKSVAAMTTR